MSPSTSSTPASSSFGGDDDGWRPGAGTDHSAGGESSCGGSAAAQAVTAVSAPFHLDLPGPPNQHAPVRARRAVRCERPDRRPARVHEGRRGDDRPPAVPPTAPVLERTVELPDPAAAVAPRAWTVDTAALAPGGYVVQLTLRDDRDRSAQTAMVFAALESRQLSQPIRGPVPLTSVRVSFQEHS